MSGLSAGNGFFGGGSSGGGGGGSGSKTLISSVTTTANQGTVTFSSIPQTYLNLYITVEGASTQTSTLTSDQITMQYNGDTTSGHYTSAGLAFWSSGSAVIGSASATLLTAGLLSDQGATATNWTYNALTIFNYTQTNYPIEFSWIGNGMQNNVGAISCIGGGRWIPTSLAGINSLTFGLNTAFKFSTGTVFTLYGVS